MHQVRWEKDLVLDYYPGGGAKIRPPVIASVDGPTIFFLKGSMKYMALV